MILIDGRMGSMDLVAPLSDAGVPVDVTTLEFGDLAFTGRGAKGADVWVGVEHKRFVDFLNALDSRLPGHQLPGLVQAYDRPYLIVEGQWTHDIQGRVVGPSNHTGQWVPYKGCPPASALEQRLITLETRGGLTLRLTPDRRASIRFIIALYRWWTDHALDEHKSHLAVHAPDRDSALLVPMSDFRRAITMLLPGIGMTSSRSVESHFKGSLGRMCAASEDEWAALEVLTDKGSTRKLGRSRAKKIREVLLR